MSRHLLWFSGGAASAVAAWLYLQKVPQAQLVTIDVAEEHPDTYRFRADVERWLGRPILALRDDRYGASPERVFLETGYLVGPRGAACTRLLKKAVRERFQLPDDTHVFGFTAEEGHRLDRLIDSNNIRCEAPLIDAGLGKSDCLGVLRRVGIALPVPYRLGFANNNCLGCVKGGAGYWNRIRLHFPSVFAARSAVEVRLRRTILDVPLSQLDPSAGRHDAPLEDCSIFCELALSSSGGAS